MKKFFVILAAAVAAVSCNWDNNGSDTQQPAKFVDRLVFGDGSSVNFTYDGRFVTGIDYSTGEHYTLEYDFANAYDFDVKVVSGDGSADRTLKFMNAYLRYVTEGGEQISELTYRDIYNYNLTDITNTAENVVSDYIWRYAGYGYVLLPNIQTDKWYEGDVSTSDPDAWHTSRTITYSQWDGSAMNIYSYMNFMPLILPEYTETSGVDGIIIASLGCMRTWYLPSTVNIETKTVAAGNTPGEDEDNDNDGDEEDGNDNNYTIETKTLEFSYKYDADGYLQTVYSGTGAVVFSVEYLASNPAATDL